MIKKLYFPNVQDALKLYLFETSCAISTLFNMFFKCCDLWTFIYYDLSYQMYIYNVYIIEYIELERKREKLFYTLECLFDTINCKSICW